jgi:uncharacterized protein YndB with AHSA1/START domain
VTPSPRLGSAEVTLVDDTSFRIVRAFDTTAERLWEVWTQPAYVRRWWPAPGQELDECTIDLRVGGAWRYAIDDTPHGPQAWRGSFLELAAPHRIVSTELYEPFPDAEATNTFTLTEDAGVTTLEVLVRHRSAAARDGHLQSGMEAGLQLALDRVEGLV